MAALIPAAPAAGGEHAIRIATFNAGLSREGPGLLLRDILSGADAQIDAARELIARVSPDILLLTGFDHDYGLVALGAFASLLREAGVDYPYLFARRPNTGMATGLDMDGDGRRGTPRDAQGFGAFAGQKGMALLSRLPFRAEDMRDFSGFPWQDLPGARLPETMPEAARAVQRLSSVAHWDVPVQLPGGAELRLLAWQATPPVFDGPEDRNGLRNRDENRFWALYLDGALPFAPPDGPLVLLGSANLDPLDGEGYRSAIAGLLDHPRLQDPAPRGPGGPVGQGAVNLAQRGDPLLDTADWNDETGPGNLRVDYVLPSRDLEVLAAGVAWSDASGPGGARLLRHGLVWTDVRW